MKVFFKWYLGVILQENDICTKLAGSTFVKDRQFSKSCFTSKMCSFSVQNHKMCSEQRSVFTNVFLYDTCIQEISKTYIWLLVSF